VPGFPGSAKCASLVIRIGACEVYETPAGAGGMTDEGVGRSNRDEANRTATINVAIV